MPTKKNQNFTDNYFPVIAEKRHSLFVKKEDADFFNVDNFKQSNSSLFLEPPKKVVKEIRFQNTLNDQNIQRNGSNFCRKTDEAIASDRFSNTRFVPFDKSHEYRSSFIEQPQIIFERIRKIY